ncbi:hypothetical protein STSP2_00820 [Anaerohalosphaera lusitana]|uniref:Ig-like domain-containing protein n=1 Tax=Anaerohalosphaera lusitana TaxID=1936003 RepID=A0A1U9NIA8_9BACT|nr:LamG-like jellyroll fold domain-containing protein [Anaerohalosphaera lusitana]AQT67672.1 hypothetical protein STSP2_00820 [Anaerohalosphaera lusitana]
MMKKLALLTLVIGLVGFVNAEQVYRLDFGPADQDLQSGFTSVQFDTPVTIDGADFHVTSSTGSASHMTNGNSAGELDGLPELNLLYDYIRQTSGGGSVTLTFSSVKSATYTLRYWQWVRDIYNVPENVKLQEQGGSVVYDFGKIIKSTTPYETVVYLDSTKTYELVMSDASARNYAYIAGFELIENFDKAHNPTPRPAEDFVSTNVTLEWNTAKISDTEINPDVNKHYLYGNINNAAGDPNMYYITEIPVNGETASYGPITLDYNTTYTWKVEEGIADGAGGTYPPGDPGNIDGYEWTFTTTPAIPVITTDPVSQLVEAGADATFTVSTENADNIDWYKYVDGTITNDTYIASGSTLTITGATAADEGRYFAVATNNQTTDQIQSATARLMTKRLVAHWDFEGDLIDEVAGFTGIATDPNQADGDNPAFSYVTGVNGFGQALELTADTYVEVQNSVDAFNFYPTGFTVSAWVKKDGGGYQGYIGKNDRNSTDTQQGFSLYQQYSNGGVILREAGGLYAPSGTDVNDNNWHLVVGLYDADAGRLAVYVDGLLTGETSVSGSPLENNSPLLLGVQDVNTETGQLYWPFNGTLDEVKLYSYPISDTAIGYEYLDFNEGTMCVDDEGLQFDFNDDCVVDINDFAEFASTWLNCREIPTCLADPR